MACVSVIIPVYNIAPYLEQCVDSLLCQTLSDIEIILVDDGSTDAGGTICDEYASKDDRITVIHQANGGLSAARNAGIDVSRGEFIGFVDGDDWVQTQMYETLYAACLDNDTSLAACDYLHQRSTGDFLPYHRSDEYLAMTAEAFFGEVLRCDSQVGMGVWNKLFRRDLFDHVRFPAGKLHEDTATLYQLVFSTDTVSYLGKPLYVHISREDSITQQCYGKRDHDRYEANTAMFDFIREHYPDLLSVAAENHCISNSRIAENMVRSHIFDKEMYQKLRADIQQLLPVVRERGELSFINLCKLDVLRMGYTPFKLFDGLYRGLRKLRI